MTNRNLAIFGAVTFMVLFFVQTDAIRQAAGVRQPCPSCNVPAAPSLHRLETYALLIFNELTYENHLRRAELVKQHPDLEPELRYREFVTAVANAKIGANLVKFRPLRAQFEDDFEALKTRYLAENPDAKLPE
jgi:hypothetical protein